MVPSLVLVFRRKKEVIRSVHMYVCGQCEIPWVNSSSMRHWEENANGARTGTVKECLNDQSNNIMGCLLDKLTSNLSYPITK